MLHHCHVGSCIAWNSYIPIVLETLIMVCTILWQTLTHLRFKNDIIYTIFSDSSFPSIKLGQFLCNIHGKVALLFLCWLADRPLQYTDALWKELTLLCLICFPWDLGCWVCWNLCIRFRWIDFFVSWFFIAWIKAVSAISRLYDCLQELNSVPVCPTGFVEVISTLPRLCSCNLAHPIYIIRGSPMPSLISLISFWLHYFFDLLICNLGCWHSRAKASPRSYQLKYL